MAENLYEGMQAQELLRLLYRFAFERDPDPVGIGSYLPQLQDGTAGPHQVLQRLVYSDEWCRQAPELGPSLHMSRRAFVRSLPPAKKILDLGGTALGVNEGALVVMGYPYPFEQLTIVDLPTGERHDLYREEVQRAAVMTELGPVHYQYHSMTDLSRYGDSSFDLVVSGESIEHVTQAEARSIVREAWRVLRPGGYLALDTPNARVTRLQQAALIDPDHKREYTHQQMARMLRAGGFEIVEARGISYAGESIRRGQFDPQDVAANGGLFWDIEDCYLLGYICRRPEGAGAVRAGARRATARAVQGAADRVRRHVPPSVKDRIRRMGPRN